MKHKLQHLKSPDVFISVEKERNLGHINETSQFNGGNMFEWIDMSEWEIFLSIGVRRPRV